jgi:hypothetical protein
MKELIILCARVVAIVVLMALGAGGPPQGQAAEAKPRPGAAGNKAKGTASERKARAGLVSISGKICAVNPVDKTIAFEGKPRSGVLYVRSNTRMMKNGEPATFDAAVVGEQIAGRVRSVGGDKFDAVSLRFGSKAQGQPAPKAKPKAARTRVPKVPQ